MTNPEKAFDYNRVGHSHCWDQKQPSACGIPLEKHTQCCLCDMKIVADTHIDIITAPPASRPNDAPEVVAELAGIVEQHTQDDECTKDRHEIVWNAPGYACQKCWLRFVPISLLHTQRENLAEKLEWMKKDHLPFHIGTMGNMGLDLSPTYNQAIDDVLSLLRNQPL